MSIFIQDSWTEVLFFVITLVAIIVSYFHTSYQYWSKKGVPFIRPRLPLGNTNTILPRGFSVGTLSKKFYDEFKKRGHKFGGVYLVTEPNLVVVDPEYVKDILARDFEYFVDRGFYHNVKNDPLTGHLFALDGSDWRNLRIKLTPTFTSSKMKMMFQTVIECSKNMKQAIEQNLGQDMEIKEVLGRFSTDVIGSCAFGIDCNSFKHPNAEFRTMGKRIFYYDFWRSLKAFFMMNLPNLSLQLGLATNRPEIQTFFRRIVADTVKMRTENKIRRNDFLQILIDLKDNGDLTLDEITAQVFIFFIAGFETSSTAMTFALYELAKNPDIQKTLRQEIRQTLAKYDDQITYENLSEMKYLGQVFEETVRMYPPFVTLNRRCVKNYTLRGTDVVIEKGTPVLIPTLGLHMDPEYFPEPDKFDPGRFSDDNKRTRHSFVHLPFGDGPRNCIGLRFGLMQSKIGIATIVKDFNLSVSSETGSIELDPYVFLLKSTNTVYIKAERVQE